jgi:hypothetical protein
VVIGGIESRVTESREKESCEMESREMESREPRRKVCGEGFGPFLLINKK